MGDGANDPKVPAPIGVPERGRVPFPATWMVAAGDHLVVGGRNLGVRIDPRGGSVERFGFDVDENVRRPMWRQDSFWSVTRDDVIRIDPRSGSVSARIPIPRSSEVGGAMHLVRGTDEIIVFEAYSSVFTRIDAATRRSRRVPFAGTLNPIAATEGVVWSVDRVAPVVVGLDVATGEEIARLDVEGKVRSAVARERMLWLSVAEARFGPSPTLAGDEGWVFGDGNGNLGPSRVLGVDAGARSVVADVQVPMSFCQLHEAATGVMAFGSRVGRRDLGLSPVEMMEHMVYVLGRDGDVHEVPSPVDRWPIVLDAAAFDGSTYMLQSTVEGMYETGSVVRVTPRGDVDPVTDLRDVEITDLLPPMQAPPTPDEFERSFVEELRSLLSGSWTKTDPRTGRSIPTRSLLGPGARTLIDVRTAGSFPRTIVEILFTEKSKPYAFGLRLPVWFEDGSSWDGTNMSPAGAASILQVNVFEEPPWLRTPDEGMPDGEGIVWL